MTRNTSRTIRSARRTPTGEAPKGPAHPNGAPTPRHSPRGSPRGALRLLGELSNCTDCLDALCAGLPAGTTHRHAANCYGAPLAFGTYEWVVPAGPTGGSTPSASPPATALGFA